MSNIFSAAANTPLVSVIIPCYNVAGYVERAVNSILNQTCTNLEIWLINDGSTDDTLQKINAFKDPRINVESFTENSKKIGAVNNVLKKVKGDFICFQDADDFSYPARIEKQLNAFATDPDLGICFTGYNYSSIKDRSAKRIALTDAELRNEFLSFGLDTKKEEWMPTLCATMMITKQALQATNGYHPYFAGRVAEDIHWVYRILKHYKGGTVADILYQYCFRAGSFMHVHSCGLNAKYIYSWKLLSKIIYKDMQQQQDVLAPENGLVLKALELEACEEMLVEKTQLVFDTRDIYEKSRSFKLGRWLLYPWRLIKTIIK